MTCAGCGVENPGQARFCMGCGAPLGGDTAEVPRAVPPPDERRRVTILFADLSGYTAMAERLDPEVVKGVVSRILRRLSEEVHAHGGTVDKFIGDNVMALFGAPVAHEDDEVRAVRAGLGMQAAMNELNPEIERAHGVEFALRVGINTGAVLYGVVGDSTTVTGDAVNVAARLQAASGLGAVTVGERTMRAAAHAVAFTPIAPLELKGKAQLVPAYEATALLEPHANRRRATESPLVGRRTELALVLDAQQRADRERHAQLLTVFGPAGVGKSRLLREAQRMLAERDLPPTLHEGRCPAYGSGVFWPLTELLRAETKSGGDASAQDLSEHLDALLERGGEDDPASRRRAVALIAQVLGFEPDTPRLVASEDPERVREGFFAAVRSAVEGMASRGPVTLAFEDIHWAEDGMLDLIQHLARFVRGPVLILCLAREDLLERRQGWGTARRSESVHFLDPLEAEEAAELVTSLLPSHQAPLAAGLAERAGGNPLFAEEMARSVVEEGAAPDRLPDTVQAVLAARLDSLEPVERRAVQHAAVIGSTFGLETLELVGREDGVDLHAVLSALAGKKILVHERPDGVHAGPGDFAFRHVLIRDVAYETLPKAVRAHKHFEVGALLERQATERGEERAPVLAEHYGRASTLGRETGLDAPWLGEAAQRAAAFHEAAAEADAAVGSNREAAAHLEAAVRFLPDGDPALARISERLGDVVLRTGHHAAALEQWRMALAHHRAEGEVVRAADLLRKIGRALAQQGERRQALEHLQAGINSVKDGPPSRELARLYEEMATVHLEAGNNMLAIYAAERALSLAERLESPLAAGRAHGIFGQIFARMGDSDRARQNLERSVELARGNDGAETVQALVALARQRESSEGDLAGADAAYAEALEIAAALGDAPAQVAVHAGRAQIAILRADWDAVSEAEAAMAQLADRGELGGQTALPLELEAVAAWRRGDLVAAAELYRRAHAVAEEAGWSEIAAAALGGLALSLRDTGDLIGAVGAYDRAVEVCDRAGMAGRAIQMRARRAVALELAGRHDAACRGAADAAERAARLPDPAAQAAVKEAAGGSGDAGRGVALLIEAAADWERIGRPVDAARCEALAARRLAASDPEAASAMTEKAAAAFDRLGVRHLAEAVRAPLRGG